MSATRNLITGLAINAACGPGVQAQATDVPEISSYTTWFQMEFQTNESVNMSDLMTEERVSGLEDALRRELESKHQVTADFTLDYAGENTFEVEYESAELTEPLESILTNTAGAQAWLPSEDGRMFELGESEIFAEMVSNLKVILSVEGLEGAAPEDTASKIAQDVTKLTQSTPDDVKVLAVAGGFIAYLRMDESAVGKFETMRDEIANTTEQLAGDWLTETAKAAGVSKSALKISDVDVSDYTAARGYIEITFTKIDYGDDEGDDRRQGSADDVKTLLMEESFPREDLLFAIYNDLTKAIQVPAIYDEYVSLFEIVRPTSDGFVLAYDAEDPIMWVIGRLVNNGDASFPLTSAEKLLADDDYEFELDVKAMEQQDRSTEAYGMMTVFFVGATGTEGDLEEEEEGVADASLEYALRNDIIKAAELEKQDLFDVYVITSNINQSSIEVGIEHNSAEAYEKLKVMLKDKESNDDWLVETRALQPSLSMSRFTDDTTGLGDSRGLQSEDKTCRVGGLHCDHVKGIVALLLVTIVVGGVGYYCLIHRPSKKKKSNEVQEIQPNHTFVFSRSLGASTHGARSAAGSFYGGGSQYGSSRHGGRGAATEEVDMGQVDASQFDDNVNLHNNHHHHQQYHPAASRQQHPASFV